MVHNPPLSANAQQAAESISSTRELIHCPHCHSLLSEEEIRSILGQFGRAKWKKPQVSRFAKMTEEERKIASSKASHARWAKAKGNPSD